MLWMRQVQNLLKILGLSGVKKTYVGDAAIRGISGGQKRRVTLGEMGVTPRNVQLMDCISNGLDSATTFEIIRAIQNMNHIFHSTILIALLQVNYLHTHNEQ
jgi:ABC-type multidrug transport system ATPase subunit